MGKTLYNEEHLREYIDLVVRFGVNIQKGQELLISGCVDCAGIVRKAVVAAYEAGASNVYLRWIDDISTRVRYLMGDESIFDEFPKWDKLMYDTLSGNGAAFMSLVSNDPEAFKGVAASRLSRWNIATAAGLKRYYDKVMSNQVRWSIAAVPSEAWANKVFPDASGTDEAISLLWDNIFAAARVGGGDAVEMWKAHVSILKQRARSLNDYHFASLHFKNSAGTDLHIKLPERHLWAGGGDTAKDGHAFLPNIPTEELFTAPLADGTDGTVVGTMPNVFRGNLIRDFSITFKNGKVVSYKAKEGGDHLKNMISDIPGMDRLGEIALVEHDSPISNTGILYYNTLFDENASCHLALGNSYADCIEGGSDMSEDERRANGLNISDSHQDFMFGSKDMLIMGVKSSGEEVTVFENGCFAI